MTAFKGRLEAHLTSPAGTYSITDSGGLYSASLAAGFLGTNVTYSTFLANWAAWANTNGADTWALSLSGGESGTGLVTMSCDSQPWSMAMPAEARALIGFTGNITNSATANQTGTNHAIGAWLPSTPLLTERGYNDAGTYVTDMRQTVSPRGDVYTVWANSMTENNLTWRHTTLAKTLISGGGLTNQSFESFWRNCILGENAAFLPGCKLTLFWDADSASPTTTYRSLGLSEFRPAIVQPGWTGLWDVTIPRVIKVP